MTLHYPDAITADSAPIGWSAGRIRLSAGPLVATLGRVAVPLLVPASILAAWSFASHEALISPLILPPPSLVLQTGIELAASGQLFAEIAVSLQRVMLGLALGGTLGVALGIAMGWSRTIEAYLGPFIRGIWLVPSLGWIPFLMLFLGIGEALKLAIIAKACFLPLLINSFEGVRCIPKRYLEVARVLELPRLTVLRVVLVPAILPTLFTGFRFSVTKGWQALIVVEMIASAAGIGYLMTWGRTLFQLDIVMVTMVVIGLGGWALDHGLQAVEQRLTLWSVKSAG